jgi:cobalt-zinc-cadmium efflux system membrane fusion protein
MARAQLDHARANLQLARSAYGDSFVMAPFNGVVTARNVNPGEMASNTAPVVSLVNLDRAVVKATASEDLINELKQGQQVQVKVPAVSQKPFTGVITNISPAMDPIAKAFAIKVEIDNPDYKLKPGIFAEVLLNSGPGRALMVPREAVVKDSDKDVVWVVEDGIAVRRGVKAGASQGKKVIILEGVKEGDQVVISGQDDLKDGAAVRIKNQQVN